MTTSLAPETDPRRERIGELYAAVAEAKAGEAAAQVQLEALRQRLAEAGVQAPEVAEVVAVVEVTADARHLVFATVGTAYELVELDGPAPEPGAVVELESTRHLVLRVGPSPLAGSQLRCAYTIPA